MARRQAIAVVAGLIALAIAVIHADPASAHGRINDGHGKRTKPVAAAVVPAMPSAARSDVNISASTSIAISVKQSVSDEFAKHVAEPVHEPVDAATVGNLIVSETRLTVVPAREVWPIGSRSFGAARDDRLVWTTSDRGIQCCADGFGCCCQSSGSTAGCCAMGCAMAITTSDWSTDFVGHHQKFLRAANNWIVGTPIAPAERPPARLG